MKEYINICLKLAYKNIKKNEIPVSAIIIRNGKIISKAVNKKNISHNALKHAEIIAVEKASKKLKRWNLNDCIMFVTLQPCLMCEQVIKEARIKKVYYLTKKLEYKKSYQKTEFIELINCEKQKKDYQKKLKDFFANKR